MRPVSLLYLTYNRLEFTKISLPALLKRTNWDLVERFCLWDDSSEDGTWEYLNSLNLPKQTDLRQGSLHIITETMNQFIFSSDTNFIAKIDNDVIVEKGWLEACLSVLQSEKKLGFLGMEVYRKGVIIESGNFSYIAAEFIGGVGVFRRVAFQEGIIPLKEHLQPQFDNQYFGFTRYQQNQCKHWLKGFIQPCFIEEDLDYYHNTDNKKYKELTEKYVQKGWQRRQG